MVIIVMISLSVGACTMRQMTRGGEFHQVHLVLKHRSHQNDTVIFLAILNVIHYGSVVAFPLPVLAMRQMTRVDEFHQVHLVLKHRSHQNDTVIFLAILNVIHYGSVVAFPLPVLARWTCVLWPIKAW